MMSLKTADYGTVEPVVVEKQGSKKAVLTVAALLVCAAVVGFSFTTGSNKAVNVIDSNQDRATITVVSEDLATAFNSVCGEGQDSDMRYLIATFNEDGTKVIPAIAAKASMHWKDDFSRFKSDMSQVTDLSDRDIAFAVYNFPVWSSHEHESYEIYPTFVTYKNSNVDIKKMLEAATFLGGVRMAAGCTHHDLNLQYGDGYESACHRIPGVADGLCTAINDIECPFTEIEDHINPCQHASCESEGAPFDNSEMGFLGDDCCGAIEEWCDEHRDTAGCGTYAFHHIYNDHCNVDYVKEEPSESILYHPVLVAAKEEEEAARIKAAAKLAAALLMKEQEAAAAAAALAEAEAAVLAAEEPLAE